MGVPGDSPWSQCLSCPVGSARSAAGPDSGLVARGPPPLAPPPHASGAHVLARLMAWAGARALGACWGRLSLQVTLTLCSQLCTVSITSFPLATSEPVPAAWSLLVCCVCVCMCTLGCACVRMWVGLGESLWPCDAPPSPLLRPPRGRAVLGKWAVVAFCSPQTPADEDPLVGAESPPCHSFPGLSSALGVQPALFASCSPWGLCGPPREERLTPRALPCAPGWPGRQRLPAGAPASTRDA